MGMLKLGRVLRGLKKHDKKFEKLMESLNRHEAQLVKLREDMNAGFKRYDEVLEKHAQELAKLREDFNKMLSAIAQIQEEQRGLSEGYERLEKRVGSLEGAVSAFMIIRSARIYRCPCPSNIYKISAINLFE